MAESNARRTDPDDNPEYILNKELAATLAASAIETGCSMYSSAVSAIGERTINLFSEIVEEMEPDISKINGSKMKTYTRCIEEASDGLPQVPECCRTKGKRAFIVPKSHEAVFTELIRTLRQVDEISKKHWPIGDTVRKQMRMSNEEKENVAYYYEVMTPAMKKQYLNEHIWVKYILSEQGIDLPQEFKDIVMSTSDGNGGAVNKNTVYMPLVVAYIVKHNNELGRDGFNLESVLSMMLASKRQFVVMFKPVLDRFYDAFSVFRDECNPRLLPAWTLTKGKMIVALCMLNRPPGTTKVARNYQELALTTEFHSTMLVLLKAMDLAEKYYMLDQSKAAFSPLFKLSTTAYAMINGREYLLNRSNEKLEDVKIFTDERMDICFFNEVTRQFRMCNRGTRETSQVNENDNKDAGSDESDDEDDETKPFITDDDDRFDNEEDRERTSARDVEELRREIQEAEERTMHEEKERLKAARRKRLNDEIMKEQKEAEDLMNKSTKGKKEQGEPKGTGLMATGGGEGERTGRRKGGKGKGSGGGKGKDSEDTRRMFLNAQAPPSVRYVQGDETVSLTGARRKQRSSDDESLKQLGVQQEMEKRNVKDV
jgi:hypothetical protein